MFKKRISKESKFPPKFGILSMLGAQLLLLFIGGATARSADALPLVENGKSSAQIVTPSSATEAEKLAAKEIQKYIEKISGAELPIVSDDAVEHPLAIVIGNHPMNAKTVEAVKSQNPNDIDAFAVVSDDRQVSIFGNSETAMLWAAWDFLEGFGVRWLMPGEHGTYAPKSPTLLVESESRFEKPRLKFRGQHYHIHPDNDPSVPAGFSALDEYGISGQKMYNLRVRLNDRNAFVPTEEFLSLGLGHTYDAFLSPSEYFADHPEWFNMKDGKRLGMDAPTHQICFTNEEAAKEFAKNAVKTLTQMIETQGMPADRIRLGVSPNDWWVDCECEKCAELKDADGSSTSLVVNFANMVTDEVHKTFPDVPITFYAYLNHSTVPDHVKPVSGAFPELCSWSGNESFAVNQAHPLMSQENQIFRDAFEEWSKISGGVSVYTYYGHYNWFTPWPMTTQMAFDIKKFSENPNFYGMQSESHIHWGTQGLTFWLYPKLMWNPDLDVKAAVTDFCRASYGPAAEEMEKYFDVLQQAMDSQVYLAGSFEEIPELLNDEIISACNQLIASASSKIPEMDEDTKWRTQLAVAAWENSAKFAEAVKLMRAPGDYGDRAKILATATEVDEFMRTDLGKWAFEYVSARAQVKNLLESAKLDLRAVPKGDHSYKNVFTRGGALKIYASISGFDDDLWGYSLPGGAAGKVNLELKPVEGGEFTRVLVGWNLLGNPAVELYGVYAGGERRLISDDLAKINEGIEISTDHLKELMGIDLEVQNLGSEKVLILTGITLEVSVE